VRVLVVEDERTVASALRRGLQAEGYDVDVATNGEDGLSMALDRSPADLIVDGVRAALPLERLDKFWVRNGALHLALAESPFYRFQDVELSESELEAFEQIRAGSKKLGDFVDADESLRRTLYGMLVTGLLDLRERASAPASAGSAGAASTGAAGAGAAAGISVRTPPTGRVRSSAMASRLGLSSGLVPRSLKLAMTIMMALPP